MTNVSDGKLDNFINFTLDHFVIIMILVVGVSTSILFIIYVLPEQQASEQQYNKEQSWLPNANCAELKQYIIESLDGKITHYFQNHAQELYDWKCSK
jgi:hypothetical protein